MTTEVVAIHRLAVGRELHPELFRTRAVILALLATLCFALFARSAPQLNPLPSANVAQRAADRSIGPSHVPVAGTTIPPAARDPRPEIDALARLIAKRYRISSEATRGLIAAAYREGQQVGLDPLLIVAVIAVESRFNPIAESDAGAQGLMQVIPSYHKDRLRTAGIGSVLEPRDNIRLGAQILKEYIRRGGTEVAGLQIYNGGSADASNAYAAKVLAERQRLQQAMQQLRDRLRA